MGFSDYLPSFAPPPRPDLQPLHGTVPLTPQAAVLPPLIYYLALILLPPFPESSSPLLKTLQSYLIPFARNTLALLSAILFFRLPLAYHVPFSIGLTYQLSLVGLYGGCRIIDVFFITFYGMGHIPRRVKYHHAPRHEDADVTTPPAIDDANDNTTNNTITPHRRAPSQSYFSLHFLRTAGLGDPVTETASTHPSPLHPTSMLDRLSFALELLLSMRGAGFTWTSADVRHTRRTWRPSAQDRGWSIAAHVLPTLVLGWAVVRDVWVHYLAEMPGDGGAGFDGLPVGVQIALTGALGAVLMGAFSLAYSAGAIVLGEWGVGGGEHALAYWPPLYSVRVWEVCSVRGFWGYGWHRLFSRLFLVWGVWPGEWVERRVRGLFWSGGRGKWEGEADMGKVMGGFCCSAFVHAFAGHAVLGGWRNGAGGEAVFFVENGVAVCVEEGVKRWVKRWRRGRDGKGREERWYDGVVGRVWWVSVLLFTGRNFARGWTKAGLVTEMAGA